MFSASLQFTIGLIPLMLLTFAVAVRPIPIDRRRSSEATHENAF